MNAKDDREAHSASVDDLRLPPAFVTDHGIRTLSYQGAASPLELASHWRVHPDIASAVIDQLRAAGLVESEASQAGFERLGFLRGLGGGDRSRSLGRLAQAIAQRGQDRGKILARAAEQAGHFHSDAEAIAFGSAGRQIAAARERVKIQIAVEVRNAAAGVETAAQRMEAARASRAAAEVQLRAEEDRLAAGATVPFFVLTRQNELAAAEVADAAAVAAYRRALTELARARGTLLRDRSVD